MSDLGSMPRSVLENILGVLGGILKAYLGAYSQGDWDCAMECNW